MEEPEVSNDVESLIRGDVPLPTAWAAQNRQRRKTAYLQSLAERAEIKQYQHAQNGLRRQRSAAETKLIPTRR